MKRIQKIALVSPNPRLPDFEERGVYPENALPLIGTVLKNAGYAVDVFMERISPIPFERVLQADLVGFSAVTCSVNRVYEMVRKIKSCRNIPTVLGGPHASMLPDDAVKHVDYVVREEGEETIIELLKVLNNGENIDSVKGISYMRDGEVYHNPNREPVEKFGTIIDLSLIHGYGKLNPIKLLFQGKHHLHFIESSRGCPYSCKFCWRIGMETMRYRDYESVIRDVKTQNNFFRGLPNGFYFLDSYFGVNRKKTKELLRRMIKDKAKGRFFVFARCEIVEDLELLELMKRVGIWWIFIGVESVSNETLDLFDKRQTIQKVEESLKVIRRYGINVCGSFMLGADTDTPETWLKTVHFARENHLAWAMFNILGEVPQEEARVIPAYRIFQRNWDYYSGHFVVHYPKKIRPSQLQEQVYYAYRIFYSWKNILANFLRGEWRMAFYQAYRRFMIKSLLREMRTYIPYLKKIEEGKYNEFGILLEDKLILSDEIKVRKEKQHPVRRIPHESNAPTLQVMG